MTDKTQKTKNDSDDRTVIGLKGAEQHHELKGNPGEDGDATHAEGIGEADAAIKDAVENVEGDNAIASALKKAVDKP